MKQCEVVMQLAQHIHGPNVPACTARPNLTLTTQANKSCCILNDLTQGMVGHGWRSIPSIACHTATSIP